MQLIPFLAAALLLFFTLFLLLRHNPSTEELTDTDALGDARQALRSLETGLLSIDIVERIFARSDRDYVLSLESDSAYNTFVEERRRIALAWVRQVRQRVMTLWHFHNHATRHSPDLKLGSEARLAWNFVVLLLACQGLELLIYAVGPFTVPSMVGSASRAAAKICGAMRDTVAAVPSRVPQF
jgi:hypothetical protein